MDLTKINECIRACAFEVKIDKKMNYRLINHYLSQFNNKYLFLSESFSQLIFTIGINGCFLSSNLFVVKGKRIEEIPLLINDQILLINDLPLDAFKIDNPLTTISFTVIRNKRIERIKYELNRLNHINSYEIKKSSNKIVCKIYDFNDQGIIEKMKKFNNGEVVCFDLTECMGGNLKILKLF